MNAIINAITNTLSFLEVIIRTTFITIFLPWRTSYEPIHALLNSAEGQKDELTLTWRTQKLAELSYVGITCAIIASVITIAITWPPASPSPPWLTTALWYGGLTLSLAAIGTATQQSVALSRLSSYQDGLCRLRAVLGKELPATNKASQTWSVRWTQLFVWQVPVMLLNFSILLFVVGLVVVLKARADAGMGDWVADDVKIFAVFGVIGGVSLGCYVSAMGLLYYRMNS